MRDCYTSKVFSKPSRLIAKMKLEKSVQLAAQYTVQHARGRFKLKVRKLKTQVSNLYSSQCIPFRLSSRVQQNSPHGLQNSPSETQI